MQQHKLNYCRVNNAKLLSLRAKRGNLERWNQSVREALINSSLNYQSTKKAKCDFAFFYFQQLASC